MVLDFSPLLQALAWAGMTLRFFSVLLLMGLALHFGVRAESPRFPLKLNRAAPKPGDIAERTIRILSKSSTTNSTPKEQTVTNSFELLELTGQERILNWDVTNDLSEIEFAVEHFFETSGGRTNALLKSGSRILGKSLLGEIFFLADARALPRQVDDKLSAAYNIRPRSLNKFAKVAIPASLAIGDTWGIATPMSLEAHTYLGVSSPNSVSVTGQLLGMTNLFGLDCFHLRFVATTREKPAFLREVEARLRPMKINGGGTLIVELVIPFDVSQRILIEKYTLNFWDSGELQVDGKDVMTSHGQMTTELVSECRPAPQRP